MKLLHRFNGGIHPPQHKTESTRLPILSAPIPEKLVIPLHQHIGTSAKPLVAAGDAVLKGQMIGKAEGYVSSSVHAPTSGKITAIGYEPAPHPSGLRDLCITLEPDGLDAWIERHPLDYLNMDPSSLRNRLRDAGVVGLGGAVFPSFIKLNPGSGKKIKTLVLNGAECEPYITCDDMLMRERADEIIAGAKIMRFMLHAEEVLIGIEDNKPEAIAAMRAALKEAPFEVIPVPTIYPGGGAKQLIRVLTGIEVPAGERSTDLGVQCFNVATALSVYRAIAHGEPVLSRIVTITGAVNKPRNYEALIGTPIDVLIRLAAPVKDSDGAIMGGPMMGFELPSTCVPLVKATNCIIVKSATLFPPAPQPMPCIRCGKCAESCPADLQPQELYWFSKAGNFGKAQEYALFDCIECGCCSYVCPSHIPLVQFYRYAKSEIWAQEREKKASDLARIRHELRVDRMEREKREKAERLAQKSAQARTQMNSEEET
ncbi:MAG: electron transport complex subunit RsxC [Burkholderiales bacterium]|nr:electron transport complex subunit RsxC [Burkholderiales bacterium]